MLGKQSVTFSCWNIEKSQFIEIQLTVQIEDKSDVDVSVYLQYEPELPEALQDRLHRRIYDGAHEGISTTIPWSLLSHEGITVRVLQLSISPQPETFFLDNEIDSLGNILEAQMRGIVSGLW